MLAVQDVPEIVPPLFKENPVGREPEVMLQEYGGTPPDTCSVALYWPPAVLPGKDVVVTEGGGTTVNEVMAVFVVSAPEVAVIVIERLVVTVLGAVYVTEVGVWFESAPQAAPTHPLPARFQVTPFPDVSFATVALMFAVLLWSTVCAEGEACTEIIGDGSAFPPPQPILHTLIVSESSVPRNAGQFFGDMAHQPFFRCANNV